MDDPGTRPEFSLIISTIGPAPRLRSALQSLVAQSYESFEVIVVDQNETDHVRRIVAEFSRSGKGHYTRSGVGLSKGRNAGLAMASGRIVGFPDDDCEYPPTLLASLKEHFVRHGSASGACVRCCDHDGQDSAGRSDRTSGWISKTNVWSRAVSVGIFLRTERIREIGGFDERIGLGSNTPYLSGEETDLLLNLLSRGHKLYYDPGLNVYHDRGSSKITWYHIKRSYAYGLGKGLVLRRHAYRKREVAIHCIRPILGAVVAVLTGNLSLALFRAARAKGRFDGWNSQYPAS
jgi:GT2 family glycosyltransferase